MSKHTDQPGNASSPEDRGKTRPWTDEEMASAEPLPLPTVDPANVREPGCLHAGKGNTKPPGRPELDSAGHPADVRERGFPHARKGNTKPAGRPDWDSPRPK